MRWPLFSREPQDDRASSTGRAPGAHLRRDDPLSGGDPITATDVDRLPRQSGPDGLVSRATSAAPAASSVPTRIAAPSAPSITGRTPIGLLARSVVDALGDGRQVPAPVGVIVDPAVVEVDGAPAAELVGRLAELLPGLRLLPLADDEDPPTVRRLDAAAARLAGVRALVAIGSSRTVDAARVLAAGGRDLTALYAGRGGSQCLLPLTAPLPLVAVRTAVLSADAPRAVVVGTDVGRLVLTGEPLEPRLRVALPGAAPLDPRAAAPLVLVGRFLGPWHGCGLPAPQRVVHDVRSALAAVLDTSLDPDAATASGPVERWEDLLHRAARVTGPPGHPCAYWLWPLAHEWAAIGDRSVDRALAELLPTWWAGLRAAGLPDDQLALWHEAAISSRATGSTTTLSEADLRIVLQRVDRWWRPIGRGIPDAGEMHRIFGPGRRSTA